MAISQAFAQGFLEEMRKNQDRGAARSDRSWEFQNNPQFQSIAAALQEFQALQDPRREAARTGFETDVMRGQYDQSGMQAGMDLDLPELAARRQASDAQAGMAGDEYKMKQIRAALSAGLIDVETAAAMQEALASQATSRFRQEDATQGLGMIESRYEDERNQMGFDKKKRDVLGSFLESEDPSLRAAGAGVSLPGGGQPKPKTFTNRWLNEGARTLEAELEIPVDEIMPVIRASESISAEGFLKLYAAMANAGLAVDGSITATNPDVVKRLRDNAFSAMIGAPETQAYREALAKVPEQELAIIIQSITSSQQTRAQQNTTLNTIRDLLSEQGRRAWDNTRQQIKIKELEARWGSAPLIKTYDPVGTPTDLSDLVFRGN